MTDARSLLHLSGVVKTFPGQVALADGNLDVAAGEIHALVGQNGSGKSTIIKLLAGYHQPDSVGEATMEGESFDLGSAHEADRLGMRFIHQNLGLVESMSALENCALSHGIPTGALWRIDWKTERARLTALLDRFGVDVDITAPVGTLPPAHRTMIAIIRALQDWEDSARLIVLDEPTATLPRGEVDRLFALMRRVASHGIGVLFVSHRLDEVFEVASRVTVFRDGRTVADRAVAELDHEELIRTMLGRSIESFETTAEVTDPVSALDLEGVAGLDLHEISLNLGAGEIVGLAGLLGSGRDEVVPLISGARKRSAGHVGIAGRTVPNGDPRSALRAGIATVHVDRARNGAITSFSVGENVVLPNLRSLWSAGFLRASRRRRDAMRWINELDVRPARPEATFLNLSGGNQQKVVLGKCLRLEPKVLLLDEPTQGVDIGAKVALYTIVAARAADGLGVLVSSGDSEELARLCHRVLILARGRVVRELTGAELTAEQIDLAVLEEDREHTKHVRLTQHST
ncbi:MAG: ribose transport system ATP-binding protein [Pseudonocardiales bacterium]|nr:ribose transport system ATP-binding protein [Pseudonocardiales bacterium]